jgi:antitoxin VapB
VTIAKVIRSGDNQVVLLPAELRLSADEVEIFRRGDEVVMIEKTVSQNPAFELLCSLPADVVGGRVDVAAQERDES